MEKRSLMKQGTHFGKPTESNSDEMSPKVNKDVEVVETHNTNRKISDEEIKNAPVLLLEELTGEVLKNNKLKINAGGLTTGLRKAKDGVAFFGKNKNSIINDFDLNLDNGDHGPHSFIIYYKKEVSKYFLKCYRDKTHTGQIHVKIDTTNDFIINKKEIVLLSETYFQLNPLSDGRIEVQNLGSSNKDNDSTKLTFSPSEIKAVTVGRDSKCTMAFPGDKSFSKIQASLIYNSDKKIWKLKDGADKPSTNGCWIYATHSFEIVDASVFQFGNSKFRLSMVK